MGIAAQDLGAELPDLLACALEVEFYCLNPKLQTLLGGSWDSCK